jgi:hypothetical protein
MKQAPDPSSEIGFHESLQCMSMIRWQGYDSRIVDGLSASALVKLYEPCPIECVIRCNLGMR